MSEEKRVAAEIAETERLAKLKAAEEARIAGDKRVASKQKRLNDQQS